MAYFIKLIMKSEYNSWEIKVHNKLYQLNDYEDYLEKISQTWYWSQFV